MTHEDPEGELLERALAEWNVPEPPTDLTDRILAHNADALVTPEPPLAPLTEETPAMLPIEHRSSSSLRPFWAATLIGFAAAAALLLAFTAGRQSVPDPPLSPSIPHVEVQVTAPAPPPAPAPTADRGDGAGTDRVIYVEETKAPPKSKRPEPQPKRKSISPELKNPFAKETEMGLLRIGTVPNTAPAEVYVDGEHLGSTPLAKVVVEAGKHVVRFEWADGAVQERRVAVEAGAAVIVRGSIPE